MFAAPLTITVQKLLYGIIAKCRPSYYVGKADALREETRKCTLRTAGVGNLASRERSVEITSGRSIMQQGLAQPAKTTSIR